MTSRIHEMLDNFRNCKFIVVGDLILDHYAFGAVNRVSPEAPIQILDIDKEEYRLGGASNVAYNLTTLGAEVTLAGVMGDDRNAEVFSQIIAKAGIAWQGVVREPGRPTTVKTRLIAQAHHLLRTDRESRAAITLQTAEQIENFVAKNLDHYQALILSDYAKGVFPEGGLAEKLIALARRHNKPVFAGPKGKNWKKFYGAHLLSANRHETEVVTGMALKTEENIAQAAHKLIAEYGLEGVIITLGAKGMFLCAPQHGGECHVAADAREVFDVAGAGDTVLSLFCLAAVSGCPYKMAARVANIGAGIVVGKIGTATVSPTELQAKLSQGTVSHLRKVRRVEEVVLDLEWQRSQGRVVVFTNGCFDILHPGHVRYLEYCKNRGDILVIGINSDASVRQLKGQERPIVSENHRAEMLAALSCSDYIVIFNELTPQALIEKIRPDVLVKGSDWSQKGVVGREFVESYGGNVELYELETGFSTTNLVEKILQVYRPADKEL